MKGVQYYGTKSLGSFRPKIWELVPADLKNTEFLEAFNSAIKKNMERSQKSVLADSVSHTFMKRVSSKTSILSFCFSFSMFFLLLLFYRMDDLD